MMPSEYHGQNSRPQKGFTLVELAIVVSIIGLLSLVALLAWSHINAQPRHLQVLNEVTLIATHMRKHANRFGEVEYKDYGSCTGTDAGKFKLVGVTLEKGKFVQKISIESNGAGEFVNPFSNPQKGYEVTTDSNSTCSASASYTQTSGATEWKLDIFEIPSDVEAPLTQALTKIPGYVSASYASGTITVTFDEKTF